MRVLIVSIALFLFGFVESIPKEPKVSDLDQLVNEWHQAASQANWTAYAEKMDPSFVFLGTAPGERWTRAEFESFAKPYFDRVTAWDFQPKTRHWQFSDDGKTAWFDETLDTWMRECRATGILVKRGKTWKIAHYNLHVLIENEKIRSFIQLRDEKVE